jgi:hypothetical protein
LLHNPRSTASRSPAKSISLHLAQAKTSGSHSSTPLEQRRRCLPHRTAKFRYAPNDCITGDVDSTDEAANAADEARQPLAGLGRSGHRDTSWRSASRSLTTCICFRTPAMSRSRKGILNSAGRFRDSAPSLGSGILTLDDPSSPCHLHTLAPLILLRSIYRRAISRPYGHPAATIGNHR